MDKKLSILGRLGQFDSSGYTQIFRHRNPYSFIHLGVGAKGECVRLFKVLQTNICENNCYYCANRKDRNYTRLSFAPKELASIFMEYYKRKLVDGLFLSSAIYKNADLSQEQIIATIKILREKFNYYGYIHTKILPDTSDDLIYEAAKYSNRLSINIEAPGQNWLNNLSLDKNYAKLLGKLKKITNIAKDKKISVITQFVVGATAESDKLLLNLSHKLYNELNLARVYYSGFIPVKNTPLENKPYCEPIREYRIYQADALLRYYNFKPNELIFDKDGFLSKDYDPKFVWAINHPELFPIEINTANFWTLIKIPGIGRISAKKIIEARKYNKIKDLTTLENIGVIVKKARNFITINGKFYGPVIVRNEAKQSIKTQEQLFLWEEI